MAKKIKQFRYYAENDTNANPNYTRNYPDSISARNLISGSIFATSTPIVQLGIQALPGTRFFLNGNQYPIIIGNTGIYELDYTVNIKELFFLEETAALVDYIY